MADNRIEEIEEAVIAQLITVTAFNTVLDWEPTSLIKARVSLPAVTMNFLPFTRDRKTARGGEALYHWNVVIWVDPVDPQVAQTQGKELICNVIDLFTAATHLSLTSVVYAEIVEGLGIRLTGTNDEKVVACPLLLEVKVNEPMS
jgi:hypothetical protein